ncbi:Fructose-1,6-bisphosphatase isozyme 2 [Dirofilaria immitis]|nr:Fructose-1,6-bisphosphatase isozyme 2 [Dirofilaria immitis]
MIRASKGTVVTVEHYSGCANFIIRMIGTVEYGMETDAMTLQRFVLRDQRRHPTATGDLTNLLTSLLTAIKAISSAVRKAGIVRLTGLAGTQNVQGEDTGETADPHLNILALTLYSYLHNFLGSLLSHKWNGRNMVAAGYALYGSATMLVLSTGRGSVGEFILTHQQMKIPHKGKIYSVNEGNTSKWSKGVQEYVYTRKYPSEGEPMNARYVGSMLRLLYEGIPMSFIIEQAGGMATNGVKPILDIVPTSIHDRSPLFLGSPSDVQELLDFIKKYDS